MRQGINRKYKNNVYTSTAFVWPLITMYSYVSFILISKDHSQIIGLLKFMCQQRCLNRNIHENKYGVSESYVFFKQLMKDIEEMKRLGVYVE